MRIGAAASSIKTEKGWLAIYRGADQDLQYCLGFFLMDLDDPFIVVARTEKPIMILTEEYELTGLFGNVVFTNGHIVHPDGDLVTLCYRASDEFV